MTLALRPSLKSGVAPRLHTGRRVVFKQYCNLVYFVPSLSEKDFPMSVMQRPARAKPKVVTLTDAAAERARQIIERSEGEVVGLRVGVKNGGCAGMAYTMEYAKQVNPLDEKVEDKGVTILIDPKAILFLLGTEMDYKTEKLSSGFVFRNPNETSACGCGESVAITPAKAL